MVQYSPKFPLFFDNNGNYASNTTIKEVVKQNLKNLLLTNPGERIMIPDFGAGLSRFLFEQMTESTLQDLVREVNKQVDKYMPFVEIQEFSPTYEENELFIVVKYYILPIGEGDILSVRV